MIEYKNIGNNLEFVTKRVPQNCGNIEIQINVDNYTSDCLYFLELLCPENKKYVSGELVFEGKTATLLIPIGVFSEIGEVYGQLVIRDLQGNLIKKSFVSYEPIFIVEYSINALEHFPIKEFDDLIKGIQTKMNVLENISNVLKTKLENGELKGEKGDRGEQGLKGDKGEQGLKGDMPDVTDKTFNHIYKKVEDFGLHAPVSINQLLNALMSMSKQKSCYTHCIINNENNNQLLDTPGGYGLLTINLGSNSARFDIVYSVSIGTENSKRYWGNPIRQNNEVVSVEWHEIASTKQVDSIKSEVAWSGLLQVGSKISLDLTKYDFVLINTLCDNANNVIVYSTKCGADTHSYFAKPNNAKVQNYMEIKYEQGKLCLSKCGEISSNGYVEKKSATWAVNKIMGVIL